MKSYLPALLALALVCMVAGCTDDDDPDDGGSGAGKHGPSAGTALAPQDLCDAFCKTTEHCFEDCQKTCASYQDPPCQAQGFAFLECTANYYDTASCSLVDECAAIYSAFRDCRMATPSVCQPEQCAGNDTSCACTRECEGGEQTTICVVHDAQVASCTCYLESLDVANSTMPPAPDLCSFATNGCAYMLGAGP